MPRHWTPHEVAYLRGHLLHTDYDIGAALGRTWRSVRMKRKRLRLVHDRRWSNADDALVRAIMHKRDAAAYRALAVRLGRTTYAVNRRAKRLRRHARATRLPDC